MRLLKGNKTPAFLLFLLFLCHRPAQAQNGLLPYPAHAPTEQDDTLRFYLNKNSYAIDTNAQGIKLWETGLAYVEVNKANNFTMQIQVREVIKLMSHKAVQDFNLDFLPLPISRMPLSITGTVYNLENDSIKREEFTVGAINNKDGILSIPSLKTGSVIDLTVRAFTAGSVDRLNWLPTWYFDGKYPTLSSMYYVYFPNNYTYRNIMRSMVQFKTVDSVKALSEGVAAFLQRRSNRRSGYYTAEAWVRKNVPAFQKEKFMPSPEAYKEQVMVQFTKIRLSDGRSFNILDNWDDLSKRIYKYNTEFRSVFRNNNFLNNELASITQNDTTPLAKAQSVYRFVRDHFTATGTGYFTRTHSDFKLKKLLTSKNGSPDEINLVLAAMLEKAGLNCELLMVAPKPNEPLNPEYPNIKNIDALICFAEINGRRYFLDASGKNLPFGLLSPEYYNGYSQVISKHSYSVNLSPDSVRSHTTVFAQISPDNSGDTLRLKLTEKLDNFNALAIREAADRKQSKAEALLKTTYNQSGSIIDSVRIIGLNNPDIPLKIIYYARIPISKNAAKLYFPLYYDKIAPENPFPDLERVYPVDMGGLNSFNYYLNFQYPDQYRIAALPQPVQASLASGSATFQAIVSRDETRHQLRVHAGYTTNSSQFPASDYQALRSLWTKMLSVTSQNIVLERESMTSR